MTEKELMEFRANVLKRMNWNIGLLLCALFFMLGLSACVFFGAI